MIYLYNGDCLEVMDDLIKQGIKVDAIITDPPYGITACKWDSVIPFNEMWSRLKLLRKEKTPIILFGSEPFSSALRMSNIKEFKYDWIWDKVQPSGQLLVKKMPMKLHEIISVFYKKQCLYNRQMTDRQKKDIRVNSVRNKKNQRNKISFDHLGKIANKYAEDYNPFKINPKSIISFSKQPNRKKAIHKTQKPIALMEYLIKTYTIEGQIVLDFTMGSGTTGIACKNLNRNFIGIELDKHYFEIAKDRIENHSVQEELF